MSSRYANEQRGGVFKCRGSSVGAVVNQHGATRTSRGEEVQPSRTNAPIFYKPFWIISVSPHRLWTRQEPAALHWALCPGQDIILYCKFFKETLQYRWCTIQGVIPPPAPSDRTPDQRPRELLRWAVKPLPLLSFSNGKGSTAFAPSHPNHDGPSKTNKKT